MTNTWESQVWRETLLHDGTHETALAGFRFRQGKRAPLTRVLAFC